MRRDELDRVRCDADDRRRVVDWDRAADADRVVVQDLSHFIRTRSRSLDELNEHRGEVAGGRPAVAFRHKGGKVERVRR